MPDLVEIFLPLSDAGSDEQGRRGNCRYPREVLPPRRNGDHAAPRARPLHRQYAGSALCRSPVRSTSWFAASPSSGRQPFRSCSPPISPWCPRGRVRASRCHDPHPQAGCSAEPLPNFLQLAYGLLNCDRRGNWSFSTSGNGRELRVRKRRLPVRVPERDPTRHAARSPPAPQLNGAGGTSEARAPPLDQEYPIGYSSDRRGGVGAAYAPFGLSLRFGFHRAAGQRVLPADIRPKPSSTIFEEGHRGEPE